MNSSVTSLGCNWLYSLSLFIYLLWEQASTFFYWFKTIIHKKENPINCIITSYPLVQSSKLDIEHPKTLAGHVETGISSPLSILLSHLERDLIPGKQATWLNWFAAISIRAWRRLASTFISMSTPATEEAKTPSSSHNCCASFRFPLNRNLRPIRQGKGLLKPSKH